jgi:hypothetical protein
MKILVVAVGSRGHAGILAAARVGADVLLLQGDKLHRRLAALNRL